MISRDNHSLRNSARAELWQDRANPTQQLVIFSYLQRNVATTSMVSKVRGIPQSNNTRFKHDLELTGMLSEVRREICEVTGHIAYFLTTNPNWFPEPNQLKLFNYE